MPPKKDPDAKPAQKLLALYGLLLFSGRKFTLGQLATHLNCSKQTVMRLIDDIRQFHGPEVEMDRENGQNRYWLKPPAKRPTISLSTQDVATLALCRDLVWRFLPEGVRQELERTVEYSATLLGDLGEREQALSRVCDTSLKGAIDYAPFQPFIEQLLKAIRERYVCQVTYKAPHRSESRVYSFAPLRILAYREALYVRGWRVSDKGTVVEHYEMVLAVQRLQDVAITRRQHALLAEVGDSQLFGFISGDPFWVKVRFSSSCAQYIRERKWSDAQKLQDLEDGGVLLEFQAQSEPEVVSWVLSFGAEAEVLNPEWLRKALRETLRKAVKTYLE